MKHNIKKKNSIKLWPWRMVALAMAFLLLWETACAQGVYAVSAATVYAAEDEEVLMTSFSENEGLLEGEELAPDIVADENEAPETDSSFDEKQESSDDKGLLSLFGDLFEKPQEKVIKVTLKAGSGLFEELCATLGVDEALLKEAKETALSGTEEEKNTENAEDEEDILVDGSSLEVYADLSEKEGRYTIYLVKELSENDGKVTVKQGTPENYTDAAYFDELPEPSLKGFEFAGWFTAKEGGEQVTEYIEEQTLFARWTDTETGEEFYLKDLSSYYEDMAEGDSIETDEDVSGSDSALLDDMEDGESRLLSVDKEDNLTARAVVVNDNTPGVNLKQDFTGYSLTVQDKVFTNKEKNYETSFVLKSPDGRKLTAGKDYVKEAYYSYCEDTVLFDGTIRGAMNMAQSTDIVPAGTSMYITVTGIGAYDGAQITAQFDVVQIDISKASCKVITQYYTGAALKPYKNQIEIKVGGNILGPDDYEIIGYSDNVKKGTGKVMVRGVGIYGGEKTINFTIATPPTNFNIIYNGNGATSGSMGSQSVAPGKSITLPKNRFVKTGFVFTGWNTTADARGVSYADQQTVSNDGSHPFVTLMLFAQWAPVTYKLTYHLNGGINNDRNVKRQYTAEDATFDILPPDRADWPLGYQFGGWFKESSYKTRISEVRIGSTGDIDLYGKWVPYNYTVYFDGNGATSGSMAKQAFSYGVTDKLPAIKYKKDGTAFAGWAVSSQDAENGVVTFTDKQEVTDIIPIRSDEDGEITLYAVWKNSFDISFETDEGSFPAGVYVPVKYYYGNVLELPSPVKSGYSFGGWYLDGGTFKKQVKSITKTTSGDLTLYAKWTAPKLTLSFKGNGNTSGSMAALKMAAQEEYTIKQNTFVRKGCRFLGWSVIQRQPIEAGMGDISLINAEDCATITSSFISQSYVLAGLADPFAGGTQAVLYAVWEKEPYHIYYDACGGKVVGSDEDTYIYGVRGVDVLPAAEREGYTFLGWYADKTYKKKVTKIAATSTGDMHLYARWAMNYTIIYNGNGAEGDNLSGTMPEQKGVKYDVATALKKNAFKNYDRRGETYGFAGWSVSPEDNMVIYRDGEKILSPSAGITYDETRGENVLRLYAVWGKNFEITYISDGFVVQGLEAYSTYSYAYGRVLPTHLVKEGYSFAGWYSDETLKKKVKEIPKGSAGDKVFYAKWTPKNYKVTFLGDAPGGRKTTGKMSVQTLKNETEKALTKNGYKLSGYTFIGWSTRSYEERTRAITAGRSGDALLAALYEYDTQGCTEDVDFEQSEKVSKIYNVFSENATLFAVWKKDVYGIVYNNVAGMINDNPDSYCVDDRIVLKDPEKLGDTFLGWYKDAAFRNRVTEIKKGTTGAVKLYAKWFTTRHTICYNLNADGDATAVLDTSEVGFVKTYDTKYCGAYRLATARREGYTFDGWYKDKNCKTSVGRVIDSPYVNLTLYAKWVPGSVSYSYTITYYLNGGTLSDDAPTGYTYGDVFELPIPERKSYQFLGWYRNEKFSDSAKITAIDARVTGNLKLYARWKLDVIHDIDVPEEYLDIASYGAVAGDGEDDLPAFKRAIQAAQNNARSGGINTVYVPAGEYTIELQYDWDTAINIEKYGDINLIMDRNAVLNVEGCEFENYSIITVKYADNVTIAGGKIRGERYSHFGSGGEYGHGVGLYGATNVNILNMEIEGNWGDGIYLGTQAIRQPDDSQKYQGCSNIVISNCEIHDNRRSNISFTDVDDVVVDSCNIYDAHGTAPQCGIYIEPNPDSSDRYCDRIVVQNTVISAYQGKDDPEYMVFMTHYNPYDSSYVTARDIQFIDCTLNGWFGNYSGTGLKLTGTTINGTVVNLKKGM